LFSQISLCSFQGAQSNENGALQLCSQWLMGTLHTGVLPSITVCFVVLFFQSSVRREEKSYCLLSNLSRVFEKIFFIYFSTVGFETKERRWPSAVDLKKSGDKGTGDSRWLLKRRISNFATKHNRSRNFVKCFFTFFCGTV
jgi:hypothetical protein